MMVVVAVVVMVMEVKTKMIEHIQQEVQLQHKDQCYEDAEKDHKRAYQ